MSPEQVYQWEVEIKEHLPQLGVWATRALALFSHGVIASEGCQGHKVARHLSENGVEVASTERRWERFLANEHIDPACHFAAWTRWVLEAHSDPTLYLLVDETKVGARLGAMVVAYRQRCIPLAWHLYRANCAEAYPPEGQVELICTLLQAIRPGIPVGVKVVVLADRGIGTSAKLAQQVAAMGWYFLFRVTSQTKIITPQGQAVAIAAQAQAGQVWEQVGKVFKKNGKIAGRAIALQSADATTPWALVTNDYDLTGWEYAYRNWQEQAFRDLKSHGWHWEQSRVNDPAHVTRLWLILVLAYARTLAWGVAQLVAGAGARLRRSQKAPPRLRWSLFRQGLDAFHRLLARPWLTLPPLAFPPP